MGLGNGTRSLFDHDPGKRPPPTDAPHHLVRSMGRLAYYARADATWTEPHGATRLHRHLELVDRLIGSAARLDSAVDPFDAFGSVRP
jgi:hypothetical protein